MSPRALALLLAPTITLAVLVGRSDAGIVVYDDGGSVVGKLDPADVTDQELLVRSPEGQQGEMRIPRHRVRWFDPAADAPTDAYFERHLDDPLESRWAALREAFVRKHRPGVIFDPSLPDPTEFDLDPLGPVVPVAHGATVRPLRDSVAEPGEVTMFVARRRGASGYAPRVHVFSVEAPRAAAEKQLGWIERELRALAVEGGYRAEELYRLREVGGGFDQVMITTTRTADGRELRALRRICFRAERTWFFSAYADAADFERLRGRFRLSLESFTPGS